MLHHSLTEDSGTVSWPAIKRYHVQTMGMQDIGYNFGVELTGDDYEALIGRRLDIPSAGCPQGNMNDLAWHICFVGDFDKVPPPPEQVEVFVKRIWLPLRDGFGLDPKKIVFHREYAPWKTCPGLAFTMKYLEQFIPGVRV
jgi:hypothetical protein